MLHCHPPGSKWDDGGFDPAAMNVRSVKSDVCGAALVNDNSKNWGDSEVKVDGLPAGQEIGIVIITGQWPFAVPLHQE